MVPTRKMRLDVALVERGSGCVPRAGRALIMAGQVTVDDRAISKAGTAVAADARIEIAAPDHPYVGRGGVKLAHALDAFGIDPSGKRALDVGASTGGFTDVLLQRGAAHVDCARCRTRTARLAAAYRSARRGPRRHQRPIADDG